MRYHARMKSLYDPETAQGVLSRIDRLTPTSERKWGKMDAAQMLAHLAATMEMACGDIKPRRSLMGYLLGGRLRSLMSDERPMRRNSPTAKQIRITDPRDLDRERERLKKLIQRFHHGGRDECTRHPHVFFGPLTPDEWATGMYKHIDHHLQQFGA